MALFPYYLSLVNINEWFSGPSTLLHCLGCRSQGMIKVTGKNEGLDLKMSGFIKVSLLVFWSIGDSRYPNGGFLSHFRKCDPHKLSQELEHLCVLFDRSLCDNTLEGNLAKMLKRQSCPNTICKAWSGDVSSGMRCWVQTFSGVNSHNSKGLGYILNSQAQSWGWVKFFHLKLPLCEKCKFGDK